MRSANEISGMVLKAARGAGMPLGYAEDIARAAPNLAQSGALGQIAVLLELPCALPTFEAGIVRGGHPVLAITAWLDLVGAGLDVQLQTPIDAALLEALQSKERPVGPFAVEEHIWASFERYAARTYVLESEASRLAGAGAGLSDND